MQVARSPTPSSPDGVALRELALRGLLGVLALGACTEQRARLEGQPGVYFEVAADAVREVPRAAIRLGECYGILAAARPTAPRIRSPALRRPRTRVSWPYLTRPRLRHVRG